MLLGEKKLATSESNRPNIIL